MSIFDKLFKKDKQPQEQQDDNILDTPLGKFYYSPEPDSDPPEIGYDGEIDWYDKEDYAAKYGKKLYQPVSVYFDCNTPDTREANICYERLVSMVNFKDRTEDKLKNAIADYFTGDDGTIELYGGKIVSKDEIVNSLEIRFISVYRNGDTVVSMNHHFTLSSDSRKNHARATLRSDGSIEVNPELSWY